MSRLLSYHHRRLHSGKAMMVALQGVAHMVRAERVVLL